MDGRFGLQVNTAQLLGCLKGVKRSGKGWKARCPAHDDHNPSLSVRDAVNGGVLIHCFAGCPPEQVCNSLGINMKQLRGENEQISQDASRHIIEIYDYTDEIRKLLYQVCRTEPKGFFQRRPDGKGGFINGLGKARRVLYRLPEVLAADPSATVFVCEGEKDADRLSALGLVATTNSGGAGKWRDEYNDAVRVRHVCILPDNDAAGRNHCRAVANLLSGIAARVRILELPNLPDKGDLSDWLDAGGTAEQLTALAAGAPLLKQIHSAKRLKPKSQTSLATDANPLSPFFPEGQTDLANARRFVELHGENVRYCHLWGKWLFWNRRCWQLDDRGEVQRLAKAVPDSIFGTALDFYDSKTLRFAVNSASARSITAMLTLATSEPGIPVLPTDFNRDPMLLNVANGTLDLRTGSLRPPERKDLLTQSCPVEFDPESECPTWNLFLETIFDRRQPLIDYVHRLSGYCLTGLTTEQILPILYGVGANGKTTLLNALMNVLGRDYAMQASRDLLLVKRGESHPTELAALFGKRLVVATETDDGRRLAEGAVKQLTGSDKVLARRMREDFWEFDPTHKVLLATNHKPEVRGTDHAIWRRLRLIPFDIVIPDAEQDKMLPKKLEAELKGILAAAVQGCLEWQRLGLGLPDEVKQATGRRSALSRTSWERSSGRSVFCRQNAGFGPAPFMLSSESGASARASATRGNVSLDWP